MEAPHSKHAQSICIWSDESKRYAIESGAPKDEGACKSKIGVEHRPLFPLTEKDGKKDHANGKANAANKNHRWEERVALKDGV